MGYPVQQNQTAMPLEFLLVASSDHLTGLTVAAPTVTLSKNGGAFAAPAGTVSEVGNGWYKVAPNATDSNTLGPLLLHATASGSDPCDDRFDVVAYNPLSTSLGLVLAKGTNVTGFNDIAATAIVSNGAITTSGGKVSEVALVDTLTTYTNDTPQSGDAYARIGATGSGLTSLAAQATLVSLGTALSTDVAALTTAIGSPAQASQVPANFTTACFASAGVFAAAALANAPTTGLALSATGLNAIAGFNGWTFPQMLRALAAFLFGKRTGVPAVGTAGTVTYTDPANNAAYGTVTVDASGQVTANAMTPPA